MKYLCKKASFKTKEEAKNKIIDIHKSTDKRDKFPIRSYKCPTCKMYHLTSVTKKLQQEIKVKQDFKKEYFREQWLESEAEFHLKRKGLKQVSKISNY